MGELTYVARHIVEQREVPDPEIRSGQETIAAPVAATSCDAVVSPVSRQRRRRVTGMWQGSVMDASDVNRPVDPDAGDLTQPRIPRPSETLRIPPGVLDSIQEAARTATEASRLQIDMPAMAAAISPVVAALADTRAELLANVDWATTSPVLTTLADTASALTDTVDLSWLQGSLSQITAVAAQQDWFTQHVQTLSSSWPAGSEAGTR
ncbi:hypothetical protein [Streptomyces sp. NBC_01214]|uniref:hypothetical protein n=1 Tax=Streptomyces sp. NBC_01214 TaxID=2903777 RepID=UPI002B1D3A7E|nr:hypothetical protein [Streptomyces sp. NBC_01214]